MRVTPDRGVGRLTKRPEFLAVAGGGRRFHTARLTAQGRRRDDDERGGQGLRVGLTLTKRVGHATERNRIRRRLRTAVATALPSGSSAPLDVVIVGRRDALSAGFDVLVDDLRRALDVLTRARDGRPTQRAADERAGPRHPSQT